MCIRDRQKGALLEYAKYVSNYYGTPRSYVEEQLNAGKNVILEIEIQGALKIKQRFPDTLLMFVCAPSEMCIRDSSKLTTNVFYQIKNHIARIKYKNICFLFKNGYNNISYVTT